MTDLKPEDIQWEDLGFAYIDTKIKYRSYWQDGQWDDGEIVSDKFLTIAEGSTALHYGQQAFEGLKAYRNKNGQIQLFRPDENGKRFANSAEALVMPELPVDRFVEAVKQVVAANADWVPPYESGSTLYIRPFMIGVGDNIGVRPAPEYIFSIFVMPVGPYFKGGLQPAKFLVTDVDRAAPHGTGGVKVGGNYAGSLKVGAEAKAQGYADVIFLDPASQTKIEEVGSANFFGITADGKFVTPKSPSILPSITKKSLMWLAENRLGLEVVEGDVYLEDLNQFVEAGAMGTAAVITPISTITHGDQVYSFYDEEKVGPVTQQLYDELVGIQFGDVEAPEGWIVPVEVNG